MDFVEALDLKDLPPNSHKVLSVNGKEVLLFNIHEKLVQLVTYVYTKEDHLMRAR